MKKLYVVPLEVHQAIGVEIGAMCWGSCGRGFVGAVGLDGYGSGIPCDVEAKDCPNFDSQMDECFGIVPLDPDGREEAEVYLRRLKP